MWLTKRGCTSKINGWWHKIQKKTPSTWSWKCSLTSLWILQIYQNPFTTDLPPSYMIYVWNIFILYWLSIALEVGACKIVNIFLVRVISLKLFEIESLNLCIFSRHPGEVLAIVVWYRRQNGRLYWVLVQLQLGEEEGMNLNVPCTRRRSIESFSTGHKSPFKFPLQLYIILELLQF